MKNYILEEMDLLEADGVEFVAFMTDFTRPYRPVKVMMRSEVECATSYPKTSRRYFKLVDGHGVYIG